MAEYFLRTERSEKQEEALQRMRDTFTQRHLTTAESIEENAAFLTDETYIRYLKARNWNVDKATTMLEETVRWRREFEVNALVKGKWHDNIRGENASGKLYVRGVDKYGNVLVYMKPKHENSRDHDNNVRHLVYNMERAFAYQNHYHNTTDSTNSSSSSATGTATGTETETFRPNKICLVVDYDGFTMANSPPLKTSLAVLSILQNHYPERLRRAYLIRTPWIFNATFKLISPFVDPVSKAKIVFMKSTDLKFIREQLSADIDPAILETEIGGDDQRPFESNVYMNAEFHLDFLSALENNGIPKVEALVVTAAVAVDDVKVETTDDAEKAAAAETN
jgi:hypothetical protein